MFATDRVERYVAPRKGRRQALRVISDLLAFEPHGAGTDLAAALAYLEPMLRRRAVIFLLSDFLGAGYEGPLGRLARRHDVIAIQVVDPRERELPDVGLVTLWDPESRSLAGGGHGGRGLRERFRARAAAFDATARAHAARVGRGSAAAGDRGSRTRSRCWRSSGGGRAWR